MEVIIRPTAEAASELAARLILDAIVSNPRLVLGLATGGTMETLYARLAAKIGTNDVEVSQITTFNLDEYIGIPPEDSHSYRYYMEQHLFSKIAIDRARTHLPLGNAADPDAESLRYEALIKGSGGIDLQLLGLGQIGHIGFNEPLSSLASRTRAKALTPETRKQNGIYFGGEDNVPKRAITVGVGTILESKRCLMLVTGAAKADILAKSVEGPITSLISATALQLHQRCTVIVDEAAAQKLTHQEYYRWIFANEPEWQRYQ
jgi:glucosamine-6-phosphate deaminase